MNTPASIARALRRTSQCAFPVGTGLAAVLVDVALAPALAGGQIDVEQMDLVVARPDLASRVDYKGTVGELPSLSTHRERADVDPDFILAGRFPRRGEHLVILFEPHVVCGPLGVAIEEPRHFGREQHCS